MTHTAQSARRIGEVDMLRGFALFGILVTNAAVLTMLLSFTGPNSDPVPMYDGTWDRLAYGIIYGFFLGKFYVLFAFLFGYSFTLQIAAAERAGAAPVPRLLRRCAALLLIGLAHVCLLWIGDILTLYALLCAILVLLRKIRPRTAVISGVILYVLFAALAFAPGGDGGVGKLGAIFDLEAIRTGFLGSPAEVFTTQLGTGPVFVLFTLAGQGFTSMGMFLIGMAAGKVRLFEDAERLRRWTPRALLIGIVVALPVSIATVVLHTLDGEVPSYLFGLQELLNPVLTVLYMATIVWLAQSRHAASVRRLAPAGRMAASNYIGQSVVMAVIFTGYGLALGNRVPPFAVLAIAVVTYLVQLWVSERWLRGHTYGPVEWVLRAATYRQWPAWRRTAGVSTADVATRA
ncbi:DUF418 domain-containing protein [Nocardia cyriacigeorgica]|jgi:uncharacterized protein|uniref:DUF418 domain-containing protein n=1 Tax=Nocardia cyriacigeorgica TaxID=135487 RepID=UPI000CEA3694|nr:DUF418 domain-containing protein [Nocardia cyriacigeorgica]AVH22255.1 DUF418 domain-containing protein [Nocardia cyriacigeorgica]MBF6321853.1 DUF418 domain-containing protein [Nocardia cyriacigeorgica]MBF6496969.1 DUF418 domain-containing protein [Nocardia cyriacigeorgica]PPJ13640.1 DUF418 domain-containing protein [Nocardia cyriacigeorgica]